MDLRQILYFIAIAEVEHFGRAAKRLRIAQPALSRQMRLLEEEIGILLFERLPRGVRLTEAGKTFLTEMRGLPAQLAHAVEAARASATGQAGRLRLGFIEAAAWHGLVPDSIREFRSRFPAVDLSLSAMPTAEQLAALRQDQMDVALIYNALPEEDLVAIPMVRHKAVLAVPDGSSLLERESVSVRDLAGLPLIGFQRRASPRFFDDLHMRYRALGFTPRYVAELMAETEILALVAAGAGAAIANSCQTWRPPHGVRFLALSDLGVELQLCLVHRAGDGSPVLEQFVGIARQIAGQLTGHG